MSNVLVVGAGPAGSRLSENLAKNGISVTLVDRIKCSKQNAFSSAALPISVVKQLGIPPSAIAASWKGWQLVDPNGSFFEWVGKADIGVVLDFSKLRELLWANAESAGVELLLGWRVTSASPIHKGALATLIGPNESTQTRNIDWIVDATGYKRTFLGQRPTPSFLGSDHFLSGIGIEYLIQGNAKSTSKWTEKITFFLGSNWVKYGYGWIFPMGHNQLKVGVCRLPPPSQHRLPSLRSSLDKLLKINELSSLNILDRHGGVISSSLNRSETHSFGRIIGVGDAVSTANLLGGEGIRHAFQCAEILSPLLSKACLSSDFTIDKEQRMLWRYKKLLERNFGWRWKVSSRLARRTWWGLSDQRADNRLNRLIYGLSKSSSADDLSALLFDYRFERYGIRLLPYLLGLR